MLLGGVTGAATLSPRDPARTNDSLLLERLQEEFEKKKERREKDFPYHYQTLVRPRGASLDGHFTVFEKRTYGDHLTFSLLLFDTISNTRSEFQVPSFAARNLILKDVSASGLPIPPKALEYHLETAAVGLTSEFMSSTRALYRFQVERLHDRARFRVWMARPTDIGPAQDNTHGEKRRLLADYSVLGAGVTGASIPEVYSFREGRCTAVKIHVVRLAVDNRPEVFQDVLCFDETRVLPQSNLVVWRTRGYELSPTQQAYVFLRHRNYDWQGRLLGGWDYRLSGVAVPFGDQAAAVRGDLPY